MVVMAEKMMTKVLLLLKIVCRVYIYLTYIPTTSLASDKYLLILKNKYIGINNFTVKLIFISTNRNIDFGLSQL